MITLLLVLFILLILLILPILFIPLIPLIIHLIILTLMILLAYPKNYHFMILLFLLLYPIWKDMLQGMPWILITQIMMLSIIFLFSCYKNMIYYLGFALILIYFYSFSSIFSVYPIIYLEIFLNFETVLIFFLLS